MANIIKPKRSSTAGKVPTTSDLASGEFGVNMTDQKSYINNGTSVVQVGAGNLTGLGDVNITSPTNSQALIYDSATSKWVNGAGGGGGSGDVTGPSSATDNAVARFDSTTGKLIQNSVVTVDDTGNVAGLLSEQYNTTGTAPTIVEGLEAWDSGNGTLELGLSGGNVSYKYGEQEFLRVYNGSGAAMTKGQVVYIIGAQGNRVDVRLAQGNSESTSAGTIGFVAEPIASAAEGWVQSSGSLYKLDTSALTAGAPLYLSTTTAGGYTTTKPTAPNHTVILGWVQRVSATVGSFYVKVDNGYELDELHNVLITSAASGNTLIYDGTAGVWENANLTAGSGISITNGAGSITIAATNSGTVTSVTGTSPVVSSGGATPAISLASGYGDTQNPYASKTANFVLAAPNGAAGVPTFRAIVAADIPTLNQNTTGTAANVVGVVAIANGGTGAINAPAALTALGAYPASNPSGYTSNTGTVTSVAGTGTVNGLTLTGTVTASGSLTLGGTLSGVQNSSLSNSAITINGTSTSLGGSINVGTVTSVTATGPVASTGGTTPVISMAQATTSVSGYLSSTDFTTFNNKANSGANTNITSVALTTGTVSTAPAIATDIANKQYVDGLVSSGITYHTPVKYEVPNTTGNLTVTYNNGTAGVGATLTNAGTLVAFTPDGVVASAGDRVLIYNQTSAFQNGVYTVTTVGSGSVAWVLTRATDANSYGLKSANALGEGDAFFVTAGTTGAGETYVCNTSGTITFGTTAISFVQVSDSTLYTAGTGLTLTGTQFSITSTGTAGSYGSASSVPVITTNAQGQVTGVTNTAIAIAGSAVSGNITGNAANVTGTVAIANGGTGATSAAAARTSLGATTVGGNFYTLANPTAVTFPRINADNTVSALDAATFRTAIGAGTSSTTGTVTSVGGTGTVSGLTLTGTVTTTGNLTLGGTLAVTPSNFASQTANTFLAAPNGAAGAPSFRTLVAADVPTLNQSTTGNAATATTLQTARTLWGQSFNGSANITGALSSVTTIGMSGQLTNTLAIGTAPMVITSTTRVANLNVATAGTADTLTTARTINGVSFNGSANITVAANTTNTLTLGSYLTGTSFNGSAAVTAAVDATTTATASKVVARDSSGYIFAVYYNATGTFPVTASANTSGMATFTGTNGTDNYGRGYTAAAAAALLSGQTMNINGSSTSLSSNNSYMVVRTAIAEAALNTTTTTGLYNVNYTGFSKSLMVWNVSGSTGPVQLETNYGNTGEIRLRNQTDSTTWSNWRTFLTNANYNSYSPTLTGTGASGTWGIAITGNAATATTATNIAGGTAGRIPYNTGAGATAFIAVGTAGQVLQSNGTAAPTWVTPSSGDNSLLWYFMG